MRTLLHRGTRRNQGGVKIIYVFDKTKVQFYEGRIEAKSVMKMCGEM